MARVMFVVPPLTGHVNPTISLGRELEALGHQVAWVGHPSKVARLLPEGAELLPLTERTEGGKAEFQRKSQDALKVRGAARFKFLWEDFLLPLASQMREGVEDAVERWAPDLIVNDQQALAGAIAAERRGLPWATTVTTSASVIDPLAGLPKVRAWLDDHKAAIWRDAGLQWRPEGELSERLVIVFSTPALVGESYEFPAHYAFIGPSISDRPQSTPFPWEALGAQPKVLVSLGTVNAEAGERFYAQALEAAAGQPWQVVLVAPDALVPRVPDNVIQRSYVPQLELLERMDAVVTHAGHNTVVESLANGLPMVCAPIKDDQPVVADQVVRAGAGVRVKFGRVKARRLRAAIEEVLGEPRYREAADALKRSFEAAGGAPRGAQLITELVSEVRS